MNSISKNYQAGRNHGQSNSLNREAGGVHHNNGPSLDNFTTA